MKITVTLNAGIELNNVELKGLHESEIQKNWDWSGNSKQDHGRRRENNLALESLSGGARANFDLNINFDVQPEELKSCYSCIEQLVKTVADSHHQTAEAVEKTAEAVKTADLSSKTATFEHPNTDVEEKVSQFMREARKVRETKNADVTYALLLGHEAVTALKNDGEGENAGTISDIQGIMDSLRKRIHNADDHII